MTGADIKNLEQELGHVTEDDIERSGETTEMMESIKDEVRRRAKDLDSMLLKASSIFESGEKYRDKTD